jgi:hypothetical protein
MAFSKIFQHKTSLHKDYISNIKLRLLILKLIDSNSSLWYSSKWLLNNKWYMNNKREFMSKCRKISKETKCHLLESCLSQDKLNLFQWCPWIWWICLCPRILTEAILWCLILITQWCSNTCHLMFNKHHQR